MNEKSRLVLENYLNQKEKNIQNALLKALPDLTPEQIKKQCTRKIYTNIYNHKEEIYFNNQLIMTVTEKLNKENFSINYEIKTVSTTQQKSL